MPNNNRSQAEIDQAAPEEVLEADIVYRLRRVVRSALIGNRSFDGTEFKIPIIGTPQRPKFKKGQILISSGPNFDGIYSEYRIRRIIKDVWAKGGFTYEIESITGISLRNIYDGIKLMEYFKIKE